MSSSFEMFRSITFKFAIFFLRAFVRVFSVDSFSIYFCTRITISKGNQIENRVSRGIWSGDVNSRQTEWAGECLSTTLSCLALAFNSLCYAISELAFASVSKRVFVRNRPFIQKRVSPASSFSRKSSSFSYERFYMTTHFETEEQGKSEMALGSC